MQEDEDGINENPTTKKKTTHGGKSKQRRMREMRRRSGGRTHMAGRGGRRETEGRGSLCWTSSSRCSISRSLLEGKKTTVRRAAADTQPPTHSSSHLLMRMHTLTLALEGLQHGGVRGAQPGGVATQNPLQVVGGIAEEHVGFAVAHRAEQAEAPGGVSKRVLQRKKCVRTSRDVCWCAPALCVYVCVCGLC